MEPLELVSVSKVAVLVSVSVAKSADLETLNIAKKWICIIQRFCVCGIYRLEKKNKTRLKNARYLEKIQNRVMTTFFFNFDAQISKSHISVSNFESRI